MYKVEILEPNLLPRFHSANTNIMKKYKERYDLMKEIP